MAVRISVYIMIRPVSSKIPSTLPPIGSRLILAGGIRMPSAGKALPRMVRMTARAAKSPTTYTTSGR